MSHTGSNALKTEQPESLDLDFRDPLLDCLVLYCKTQGQNLSSHALVAGLPISDGERLTPELFIRAAERAQIHAKFVQRELADIPNLVMPCIINLKDNQACILDSISGSQANIIMPDMGGSLKTVSLKELEKDYLGYAIYLGKKVSQANKKDSLVKKSEGHWFWRCHYRFCRYQYFHTRQPPVRHERIRPNCAKQCR